MKKKKLESLKGNLFGTKLMDINGGQWDLPRKPAPGERNTQELVYTGIAQSSDIEQDVPTPSHR